MSDAARHYAPHEPASRPQPGPLRDWLAAMKAATGATEAAPAAPKPEPVAEPVKEARVTEPAGSWVPRVVVPAPAPAPVEESDISDLMAENIMLKARLKGENDRYDSLQGVIARELRSLRAHVEQEMEELDTMRAERDRLLTVQNGLEQELRDLRVRIAADAVALNEVRGERDLWAARAEALAQPIFQKRGAA